jgi:hypothetical protein
MVGKQKTHLESESINHKGLGKMAKIGNTKKNTLAHYKSLANIYRIAANCNEESVLDDPTVRCSVCLYSWAI